MASRNPVDKGKLNWGSNSTPMGTVLKCVKALKCHLVSSSGGCSMLLNSLRVDFFSEAGNYVCI